jgi:type I restriction enzyme S subunit
MIEGWEAYEFSNCIVDNKVGRANQINSSEIKKSGKYPVIDQGQDFIAGYSDQDEKLVSEGSPYVIFGDHTRCFKYVDFPFIVGADGTKVLSPNTNFFDPEFFYFQLLSFEIPSRGYNRHYKLLKEKYLHKPPLPEQRKIAYLLNTVQRSIEQQEKLIRTTTELKKAMMQKLFTEGLNGEKQKQTEIGLVPESWDVVELGKCLNLSQYGLSTKGSDVGNIPILRMTNQRNAYIYNSNLQYVNISDREYRKFKVDKEDVIFNRTNSFELVGRTAIFKLDEDFVFASYLIRIKTKNDVLMPDFLNIYFNSDITQMRLKSIATRGVSQSNISATRLSGFKIILPPLSEQKELVSIYQKNSNKIDYHQKKKQSLASLFKTLLHELMTGQRRVNEIDFEKTAKLYEITAPSLNVVAEETVEYVNTKRT